MDGWDGNPVPCHHRIMMLELEQVLDEEAESFTVKLWRMLVFEVRRAEAGI